MDYAPFYLTEDEYLRLHAVHGQLSLVASLLPCDGTSNARFDASNWYDFLAAQRDSLQPILTAIIERYNSERELEKRAEAAQPMAKSLMPTVPSASTKKPAPGKREKLASKSLKVA